MEAVTTDTQNNRREIKYVSWNEYDEDIHLLARKIKKDNYNYNNIICIKRGGLVIGTQLSHLLNIPTIYTEDDDVIMFNQPFLLVDDVSDTGKTLSSITTLIDSEGLSYKVATLYRKDHTLFEPDFTTRTINEWIVFPWEI